MGNTDGRSFMVQEVQEKTCCECSEKAVFVEDKKLFCPKHYAIKNNIQLKEDE